MTTLVSAAAAGSLSTPERRVEGREKVSGRMRYTADIQRPGMLSAAFAGSPFARAKVLRIDTAASKAMPGVRAVLTGADIGPRRVGRQLLDWPVLALGEVRFIGDRVAAVAADTREQAEAAARAIRVEYEELPHVVDSAAALAPDAPVLHPDFLSYAYPIMDGKLRPERPHPNVYGVARIARGADPEARFESGLRVFEHTFETPRQHCGYLEPHATLVWVDDDGTVHVQTTHKMPFAIREQLARVTGVAREMIVVEPAAIGGDFGGKGFSLDEYPCYYLAKATGRPVRAVQTYADELRLGTTRHHGTMSLKTAVDADGRFVAHASRVVYDGGAYAAPKALPWLLPGYGYAAIPYHIPDVRIELLGVYTSTLPGAHMRGPAEIQTCFAWEQHVEMIAAALGIDPLELRLRNAIVDGQRAVNGDAVAQPLARQVLDTLRQQTGGATRAPNRGRGYSLVCGRNGGGKTAVTLRLTADGWIEAIVGVPEQGVGAHTMVARVAAAAAGLDPSRFRVRLANTAEANPDPGAGASRVTHIVGRAAQAAGERLRAELEERGGEPVDEAGFDELATRVCAAGPLEVVGEYDTTDGRIPPDYSMAAYAIDVEVDRDTGAVTVLDAVLVADVGQIVNPIAHDGQMDGGFVFGLGCAMMEELPVDEDGKVGALTLGEYKLPTMRDIAPFRTVYVRAAGGDGPFGSKSAGELSNVGVAPAIANAVYQAVGVRITKLPITAERIFTALHAPEHSEAQR